jgi:hypothetical protein
MEKQNKQRLEQLVRQGLVPSRKLPMLMQAMSSLHMGKQLTPTERDILSKYMHNMTDIMLKDDSVFNRAKLHTQKTKYQTEETTVDLDEKMVDGVEIVDGPEEENKKMKKKEKEDKDCGDKDDMKENIDPDAEERMRKGNEVKARRLSRGGRSKFRLLPKEVRKQKEKAGLDEDVLSFNDLYKEQFEAALEYYGISNIRDLPEEKKADFFKDIDAALEEAKMAKKDHDGDGKVETSTAEYMGSRDKAIKKSMMKKEETEQLDEYGNPAATPDRLAMIRKAADRVQSGEAAKSAQNAAKKDMSQKGAQKGMAPVKVKKTAMQEQVEKLRKTIKEGTVREKVEAFKELNTIIEQFKSTGEL